MIASTKVMDALKGIGLNLYERKLWVALLAKGVATAGELSEIAGVPRSRTYDVLQTLADRGFVIIQTSKPLKYVTVSPKDALEKAKQKLKEEMKVKMNRIDRLKQSEIIEELNKIHQEGLKLISPEDLTGALKGRYSVLQQIDNMFKEASSSVNIVTTPVGLNELFKNHISILRKLKERGINIRIATSYDESCSDAVKALSSIAEVRKMPEKEAPITGKFYVVDGNQMMMGLSDPNIVHSTQDMMFWTKSQYAAENIGRPLFDLVWEKTTPIKKAK